MNPQTLLSASGLTQWLADFYLLATLLLVIALVARRWIRQPAHRLTVAWLVAIELAALAVVCALPGWPKISLVAATRPPVVADLPPLDATTPAARPHFRQPLPTPIVDQATAPTVPAAQESVETPAPPRQPWTWPELIAAGYSLGAILVFLRLGWGAIAAFRICRRAQPAPESLRAELLVVMGCGADCQSAIPPANWQSAPRFPRLLVSSKMTSAVALGLVRPTILLPVTLAADGTRPTVRAVLAHEWAHIRHRDLWLLALGRWLFVLLYAHPLFWLLRRTIRNDQELLADASAAGDARPTYAEQLLRWVRMSPASPPARAWAAVGIWESASQVSRRIAMLLDETFRVDPTGSRRWKYPAVGLFVLLGAACSLVTLQPARSAVDPTQAAPLAEANGEKKVAQIGERPAEAAASSSSNDPIVLPGYRYMYTLLQQPAVVKELNVTAEQKKKLQEITSTYYTDYNQFIAGKRDVPQDELTKAHAAWERDRRKHTQEQVEAILSPQQTRTLGDLALRQFAVVLAHDGEILEKLRVDKGQKANLLLLGREFSSRTSQDCQTTAEKQLAVLAPEQRSRLRQEIFGPLMDKETTQADVGGQTEPVYIPSLSPYPDFSEEGVGKQLGLSASQRKQVQDILGKSSSLTETLSRAVQKLPPEEMQKWRTCVLTVHGSAATGGGDLSPEQRKKWEDEFWEGVKRDHLKERAEYEAQSPAKLSIALRKQFEAVLTPVQLAAYKDMAFRNGAFPALNERLIMRQIDLSDRQQAALERLEEEYIEKFQKFSREMGAKMLQVLTPAQQEQLRGEIDRDGAEPSAAPAEPKPAKGPPAPAKNTGQKAGTPAEGGHTSGYAGPGPDYMFLPAYKQLADPAFRKELQISADQEKRLRAISAKFAAEYQKTSMALHEPLRKRPPSELRAKAADTGRKMRQWMEGQTAIRKQLEDTLTAKQLDAYKKRTFPILAFGIMSDPEGLKTIALTEQQREQLRHVSAESDRQEQEQRRQRVDRSLAVLSPEQQTKLRAAIERREHLASMLENRARAASQGWFLTTTDDAAMFELPLSPPYAELAFIEVRQQLGLSAAQEKQLREISAKHGKKMFAIADAEQDAAVKLTPQERRNPELRRKSAEAAEKAMLESRQQVENLLTQQQAIALKEIVVRRAVPDAVLQPNVQTKIGTTQEQNARLRQIAEDSQKADLSAWGARIEKSLAVLTPAQQQKLRDEIDRRGW